MEKAFVSTEVVFSFETGLKEEQIQEKFYNAIKIEGTLEVTFADGSVRVITAEELLGERLECLGFSEE